MLFAIAALAFQPPSICTLRPSRALAPSMLTLTLTEEQVKAYGGPAERPLTPIETEEALHSLGEMVQARAYKTAYSPASGERIRRRAPRAASPRSI